MQNDVVRKFYELFNDIQQLVTGCFFIMVSIFKFIIRKN